jgi:hypothetical protein
MHMPGKKRLKRPKRQHYTQSPHQALLCLVLWCYGQTLSAATPLQLENFSGKQPISLSAHAQYWIDSSGQMT